MFFSLNQFLRNGLLCLLGLFSALFAGGQPLNHDFLHEQYDALHATDMQQKFRSLAPMPVGSVYIQRPGEGEKEIRAHFQQMRELGFTALKQIQTIPGWSFEQVALIALEEGIVPWWFGEGGWMPITPELMKEVGLPKKMSVKEARDHPKMIAWQTERYKDIVRNWPAFQARQDSLRGSIESPQFRKVGPELAPEQKPFFIQWVKDTYGSIDSLNFAWNQYQYGVALGGGAFTSWEDFEDRWEQLSSKEYRHVRDIFRFKADLILESLDRTKNPFVSLEPQLPMRAGGEMGMFLPFSYRGVDMEGIAKKMAAYGSFYPSIHLAWHFDEIGHEIARPIYMQAALTHDYLKGGWSATWESTGGPQQFSGGKGGEMFTVDEGIMSQLMYSYLAAGYKGFGFWSWSVRTAGWEAGEFSLLDRNNEVTPRAEKVGAIGKAARKYRDELWQGHKEPLVGVYADWDNEAIWATMSVRGRDEFRQWPIEARAGVSRALINANIPYEYVTARDLKAGLAARYPIIYLPSVISMSRDVIRILETYVKEGGRLVMDTPSLWYNEFGVIHPTQKGSQIEQLFGTAIHDFQGAGVNVPYRIQDVDLYGFALRMSPTSAEVLETYDNGQPAITEHALGEGTAVVLGGDLGRLCFKPGNAAAEDLLRQYTLGSYRPMYRCEGAIVYRMATPKADHYFFINDGPATQVKLDTGTWRYAKAEDAVTGEAVSPQAWIKLDAYNGRWIRMEK